MEYPKSFSIRGLNRRKFLAGAGTVAAVAMVAGCSEATLALPSVSSFTDADILNFALNLEYLEAEFYLRAATGSGLSAADAGSGAGAVTGGTKIAGLTTVQQNFLNEVAYTEQEHVRFLRSALGSAAISRPAIDLTAGFTGTVTAANTISNSSLPAIPASFNPFANFDSFMVAAEGLEDTGVTAYNGAAPLISPAGIAAGYLAAAAGIMAVEAYHGGYFRTSLIGNGITQGTTAYPYPLYANRIAALRQALSGSTTETLLAGFQASASTVANVQISTVVPADSNAIAYHRNTDQVLHIVYGTFSTSSGSTTPSAGVSQGGFFPSGVNGNIKTTQS